MSKLQIIITVVCYLAALFLIANYAEKFKSKHKFILPQSVIYALSWAVFCTAWTFFGSVGNAAKSGISFLPVYIGPTIFMPLLSLVLLKIVRICKSQRITSIADFISSRYGKNIQIGILVTILCIIGIVPYIAIQLKAITSCINLMTQYHSHSNSLFSDTTFYISIGLAFFIIVYGIRNVDTTERHTGVIHAIAFESIIKIISFLAIGIWVFIRYVKPLHLPTLANQIPQITQLFTYNNPHSSISWFLIALVSALAIILLPRQFQVAVVENTNEQHIQKASWMFPLYLFVINIFVLPIALAGIMYLPKSVDMDMAILHFAVFSQSNILVLLVFIGGFSAATGMVIVETIALTNMISNSLTMPLLIASGKLKQASTSYSQIIINSRRWGVFILLSLAYIFEKWVAERYSIVSIGLISFVAVAQFAPALIMGIYWKQPNKKAAFWSISIGFIIWFYTLVIPSISIENSFWSTCVEYGPWHISWLQPTHLFGMQTLDQISHGIFWSLLLNIAVYMILSYMLQPSLQETYQATLFVDIQDQPFAMGNTLWKGVVLQDDIEHTLQNFLGASRTKILLDGYANRHQINLQSGQIADPRIVSFAERILGGVIGAASSRLMISAVTQDETLTLHGVFDIVKESQQTIELNKELRKKSLELEKASKELSKVNMQLTKMDELKNEFLYTVTHELRTPLTSIRALSEIIYDNPEMEEEQKQQYIDIIIKETEKLSHLITQVLNLEKYESGKQKIYPSSFDMGVLCKEVIQSLLPLYEAQQLTVNLHHPNSNYIIYADRDLIRQVLYNLISNAIKFAQHTIKIHMMSIDETIEVSVKDDGIGLHPETKDMLFDKFFQAKQGHLQKPVGSGLGLAICKKIIDLHDGKIYAENNKSKGACFTFVIPNIYAHGTGSRTENFSGGR